MVLTRIRHARRQVQQGLAREVEGAVENLLLGVFDAQASGEVAEVAGHRQRGRGKHPGTGIARALAREQAAHLERRAVKTEAMAEDFEPGHLIPLLLAPGPQPLSQQQTAAMTALQPLAPLGGLFQDLLQPFQGLAQRLQRLADRLLLQQLATGAALALPPHGQAQLARRALHLEGRVPQAGHVRRFVDLLDHAVACQFDELPGAHLLAEEAAGQVRQLVRLVQHHGVGLRQQLAEALLAQRHVGQEQVMVDDHHIRLLGAAARLHHEAVVVVWAFQAEAVLHRGGHPGQDLGVFRQPLYLRQIAAVGQRQPPAHQGQMTGGIAAAPAMLLLGQGMAMAAQVVGPPLEQRGAHLYPQRLAHDGQILVIELVLQGTGAGGEQYLAPRHQGRHQIGEGLAHPRSGLGHQRAAFSDGLFDGARQCLLGLARTEPAQGLDEGPLAAQQRIGMGAHRTPASCSAACSARGLPARRSISASSSHNWLRMRPSRA